MLDVVVAAHRLVDAEGAHETGTAEAMQWRAFGSRLLVRKPAFISLLRRSLPTVHWPEPNMPRRVGPWFRSFSAPSTSRP